MMPQLANNLEFFLGQYGLRLQNPEGLWLLLAIPVLFIIGLWMGRDLGWFRRFPIQLFRASIALSLAIAYACPVHLCESASPTVAILADESYSIDQASYSNIRDRVETLWDMRGDSPSFLVGFARRPRLMADGRHGRVIFNKRPQGLGSDLASALRFTYGLLPTDYDRRIVLFSDGIQTRGDAMAEARRARRLGIQVFTIPIHTSGLDVMAHGMDAPGSAQKDEEIKISAFVSSNRGCRVTTTLFKDGTRVSTIRKKIIPGRNQVQFHVELTRPGWHKLTVRVEAKGDRFSQNNTWNRMIWVMGSPRVLLVQRARDLSGRTASSRGSGITKANPLLEVLQSEKWEISRISPEAMPRSIKNLSVYDLIILDDLQLGKLSEKLVRNLKTSIEEFGSGLLVTAGQGASDLADPGQKPVEKILPVEFKQVKKKEQIPAALVFVTDRSSSMARGGKFSILLRAVADTLVRIKDTAQVAVVMFDDFPEVVVALTEARHREKIRKVVLSQRLGGGTSIYPALEAAHEQLEKSAAKLKHIILLSDGQSISMYDHYGYIVDRIASDNITITSVALGKDADKPELRRIAARTGGRFYFTDDITNVPKIFARETENITETNVIEQPIKVIKAKLVQALAGIDFATAPDIGGYVPSEAHSTAEVLLMSSDRSEPIIARWRYGLGRVILCTTDAQGGWSNKWTSWSGFSSLWTRLSEDAMRKTPPGRLVMWAESDTQEATVTVSVPAIYGMEQAPPGLTVINPLGKREQISMTQRGIGTFRTRFPLEQSGAYALKAERISKNGTKEATYGSVSRGYPEEFLSVGQNTPLLKKIAEVTGAKVDPDPVEIFSDGRRKRQTTEELWHYFVLASMGLFLGEILIRRL